MTNTDQPLNDSPVNKQVSKGEIEKQLNLIRLATDTLILDMNKIKCQIDTANAKMKVDGIQMDYSWLARAKNAQRIMARKHQQLQFERGKLNKELKKITSTINGESLIKVFRGLVDKEIGEKRCRILFEIAQNQATDINT